MISTGRNHEFDLPRFVRGAASVVLIGIAALACSPVDEAPSDEAEAGASAPIVIDSIELGLGFDEPVTLDGDAAAGHAGSRTLILDKNQDQDEDGHVFGRDIVATDDAGNAATVRVEVRVGAGDSSP